MGINIPGGVLRTIPIFKAGATSEDDPTRGWSDKEVASLIRYTQKALKAKALSIPLIIGHTNPDHPGERQAYGWVSSIKKGSKQYIDPDTNEKFRVLTVEAEVVMNPQLNRHYENKEYFEVSVEIHSDYVLPAAPGKKNKKYPYVIGAVAFLGESAPAHAMMFASDVDHSGNVWMYQVKNTPKEDDMSTEKFEISDVVAEMRSMLEGFSGLLDQLESAGAEEEVDPEMTADEPDEQNAKQDDTEIEAKNSVDTLVTAMAEMAKDIAAIKEGYSKTDAKTKAESDYKIYGGTISREIFDPIAAKYGAKKAGEMLRPEKVTPPGGITPKLDTADSETAALEKQVLQLRDSFGGHYRDKPKEALISLVKRTNANRELAKGRN